LKTMNVRGLIDRTTRTLSREGFGTPRLDAEVLLAACLRTDRGEFYAHPEREVPPERLDRFDRWVGRRRRGEPVAYITGEKEFWSLPFTVGPQVLVPRPETEILVEEALRLARSLPADLTILEVGAGSGAVSVALATELPGARIVATDISPDALALARVNAKRHGVSGRIGLVAGDLCGPVRGPFDLVVSNPPYIPEGAYDTLPAEVRCEPRQALIAGPDGTDVHRLLMDEARRCLRPGGWLCMEMGEGQGGRLARALEASGYGDIAPRTDYGGMERVILAQRR